ncbi:hypothetical protein [Prauserella endophytica]|uniref:ATP-binding protein n=1 Tax=Prauserella endophytica TaxID=1592324 RepID=A0ABY2RW14_9PSEU|nr:hypothetical protein [Prauserella endophytica]TKG61508.1 hypothetical protein FCN18_33245 [Prauserella endophytica]
MSAIDSSRLPRGQMEWAALIAALAATDDRAERHYLELKSELDLNQESGRAKVAKFILGAANRPPDLAARAFEGHAVMILGVGHGEASGIAPFEAHELAKTVRKFASAEAPGWDYQRIPVDANRDVIAIVVDRPVPGKMWTCYKDGPEGLTDGGIYIRADGETRPVKGDEMRALIARRNSAPSAKFDVTVGGSAFWCASGGILENYIDATTRRLRRAYRAQTTDPSVAAAAALQLTAAAAVGFERVAEDRSPGEYWQEIEDWAEETRASWPRMLDNITAVRGQSFVRVENLSQVFVEDVEVTLHLEGEVKALKPVSPDDFNVSEQLPEPPRRWGPSTQIPRWRRGLTGGSGLSLRKALNLARGMDVTFKEGSTTLTLRIDAVRPEATYETHGGEFVLAVENPGMGEIRGTWRLTARGHHGVYEGELSVPVRGLDVEAALRRQLLPTAAESDG